MRDERQNLKFSSLCSEDDTPDRGSHGWEEIDTPSSPLLSLNQLCFIFNQTSFIKILLRMEFTFNPHRRFSLQKSACEVQYNVCTVRLPIVLKGRQKGTNSSWWQEGLGRWAISIGLRLHWTFYALRFLHQASKCITYLNKYTENSQKPAADIVPLAFSDLMW